MKMKDLRKAAEKLGYEGEATKEKTPTSKNLEFQRRLGNFNISRKMIFNDPKLVARILRGTVILRAECFMVDDSVHYTAMSEDFDIVPAGAMANDYVVAITIKGRSKKVFFTRLTPPHTVNGELVE